MRRRGRWVAAATAVVVLGGGGTAWGMAHRPGHTYRVARAAMGSVTQTTAATATISPVSSADAAFQVAGTVARVAVKARQRVRAGELLAHLDRSSLREQLRAAQASWSSARNRLAADESGQSNAAASPSKAALHAASPTVEATLTAPPTSAGGLAQHQAQVRAAQQATDHDLASAQQLLHAMQKTCGANSSSTPTPQPTDSPPTQSPTAQPAPTTSTAASSCTSASAQVLAAEQQVSRDESQLSATEAALSHDLEALARSASSQHNHSSSSSSHSSPDSAAPASATQLALDQASIDEAAAQVASAEADLAQATLRSTISGQVAAVTMARGDRITLGSSDGSIKVVGSRQEQAVVALSATQVRRVKIGLPATVLPDGTATEIAGRIVAINAAGTTSQSGTTSYPVTLALPRQTHLVAGAAASVTLIVSSVDDVLTVPTSAVHYTGSRAYVEVPVRGNEVRRRVIVGAVGAARTQVRSGLSVGQPVVLADLGRAVPSSSSNLIGGGGLLGRGKGRGAARQFFVGNPGSGSSNVVVPPN